ncbi:saccharopine dehydrogenase [Granulosicoccus antarcticus]|uniref:Saccharopine dehydrogenase [NAD(+), L-lysine-forming] n=1 Tax=Granulosicoccus antarcticus IMCC3135 TaxID=1192854 RepID=A0A2Z2P061_9GAMM|nr:saccharopine dehydrogenase [Granulosicoccus antarcticus]ASJ75438.1 hypothetical protein IMCC3135_26915 [Granulosicoccus antarcticus IMCC3135]
MDNTLLWLRAETKAFEERTLVTPGVARELIEAGFELVVERSPARIFPDSDYAEAGCRLVAAGAWRESAAHAIILGLKELDDELGPFTRRHVHFAHVYKHQTGWRETVQAFGAGGGTLYDLEYLVDDTGRRVAAFGYWAGFVGAAMAVLAHAAQAQGKVPSLDTLQSWPDKNALVAQIRESLAQTGAQPNALVIGALGRCGRGACELLTACGLTVSQWDQQETAAGGPFEAVLQHDLLINCVFVNSPNPPFTDLEHLNSTQRRLNVIADVSCDPTGEYNPLPIYQSCTTMDKPVVRLIEAAAQSPALDLIAIDHLPSLLPKESSEDFSRQMLPYLLTLKQLDQGVWQRAETVFKHFLELGQDGSGAERDGARDGAR